MIYHITRTNDDKYFRDVTLSAALEDYSKETWIASWDFDKYEGTLGGPVWQVSPADEIVYEPVELANVPRWFRTMADRMKPRIVEEHFQALIDARTAEELANTPS